MNRLGDTGGYSLAGGATGEFLRTFVDVSVMFVDVIATASVVAVVVVAAVGLIVCPLSLVVYVLDGWG